MTEQEARKAIKEIPVGSQLQLIMKNGQIMDVRLASSEVRGTDKKDYGDLVVPALPPALIVQGGTRFGNFRVDTEEIVNIARVD